MCGIAGIYSSKRTDALDKVCVASMVAEMAHRGPDGSGLYQCENACLGHSLLAIVGLGTGGQPLANEDETIWVTFNGEIYNFQELRRSLVAKGHKFRTKTDTEVLVHLYEEYGLDFVHHLEGMFAFALWDQTRQRLVLVRDRLGVKPLYWAYINDKLYFASEIKALIRHTPVNSNLNPIAIDHYLAFKSVGPNRSILTQVNKLAPGCFVVFDQKGYRTENYWVPIPRNQPGDPLETIPRLISTATRKRLISEVPISVSLSGGIDSSIILYEVARFLSGKPLAFSIRYPDAEEDETALAASFASQLGVEHHIIDFPGIDLDQLPRLAELTDEPLGDYSAYPSQMLFEAHRRSSTVVLTGDGGDEAFGGYRRYQLSEKLKMASRFRMMLQPALRVGALKSKDGSLVQKLYEAMANSPHSRYESILSNMSPVKRQQLMAPELNAVLEGADRNYMSIYDPGGKIENYESLLDYLNYLPGVVLEKVDRCSMAHSVEVRSPFLDYNVAEYGLSLPRSKRFSRTETKIALRDAYRGKIPDQILDGKKRGFTVPLDYWDNKTFYNYAHDILLSEKSRNRGIFNIAELERFLSRAFGDRKSDLRQVWTILMLELWVLVHSK